MVPRALNAGRVIAALALAAVAAGPARAQTQADPWIKGTSDFLIDRANANFLYLFQSNLKDNGFFHDYFPGTQRLVAKYDLRSLLTEKKLIRDTLDGDVAAFLSDKVASAVKKLKEDTPAIDSLKEAVADAEKALLAVDPKREKPATQKLEVIRKALDGLAPAACGLHAQKARVDQVVKAIRCEVAQTRKLAESLRAAPGEQGWGEALIAAVLDTLGRSDPATAFKAAWEKTDLTRLHHIGEIADLLQDIAKDYLSFKDARAKTNDKRAALDLRFVTRVLDLVELSGYLDDKLKARIEANSDFDDFRRYAVFFAQLANAADASSPEQVKALLASVTVPDVSFGVKRESNNFKWLITAYFGGSVNWQVRPYEASHTTAAMTVPVGLELAWGRRALVRKCDYEDIVEHKCQHSSLSVLLSPVDFGIPVAMRIAGTERSAKLSDIIAPGVYFVYGVKSYPLAAGLGFVRSRSLQTPDTTQNRVVFFVGFDLPLYVLK